MALYPIFHRWNLMPIAVIEAESFPIALELAVKQGLSLIYADLRGIDAGRAFLGSADFRGANLQRARLRGTDLRKADLRTANAAGADLAGARLRQANLRGVDLRGADMRQADLRGADLRGADLRGVMLIGANLDGAILDWRWSAVPLELLRRRPEACGSGFRVVSELAFLEDTRPFDWLRLILRHPERADWMRTAFAAYIRPEDDAPELLRRLAVNFSGDLGTDRQTSAAVDPGGLAARDNEPAMLWTRRNSGKDRPRHLGAA